MRREPISAQAQLYYLRGSHSIQRSIPLRASFAACQHHSHHAERSQDVRRRLWSRQRWRDEERAREIHFAQRNYIGHWLAKRVFARAERHQQAQRAKKTRPCGRVFFIGRIARSQSWERSLGPGSPVSRSVDSFNCPKLFILQPPWGSTRAGWIQPAK